MLLEPILNGGKFIKIKYYVIYDKILVFNIYNLYLAYMLNFLTKNTPVFGLHLYKYAFASIIIFVTTASRPFVLTKVHIGISLLIDVFTHSQPPPHRLARKSLSGEISFPPTPPPHPATYATDPTPLRSRSDPPPTKNRRTTVEQSERSRRGYGEGTERLLRKLRRT